MTPQAFICDAQRTPVGRYGGEEFLIVTVDCAMPDNLRVAERVRQRDDSGEQFQVLAAGRAAAEVLAACRLSPVPCTLSPEPCTL